MSRPTKVYRSRLAEELDVPPSTIKFYTEIGLLPYELKDPNNRGSNRLYDIKLCKEIWQDIQARRENGKTIPDIVTEYESENKLFGGKGRLVEMLRSKI